MSVKPIKSIKPTGFKKQPQTNILDRQTDIMSQTGLLPAKETVEELKGQHTVQAQKARYDRASKLVSDVQFTTPYDAIVPSRDPAKPYHCTFREDEELKKHLDCECESFIYGVVRNAKFECKHIIAARDKWDELNKR